MKMFKRIAASILSVVILFSAVSVEKIVSLAENPEPSSQVEYKVSQMTNLSQLTEGGNITIYSNSNPAKASLQNGVLTLGEDSGLSQSMVFLNPYNDTANNLKYPVTGVKGRMQLGWISSTARTGTVFYFGKAADKVATEGTTTTTTHTYKGNTVNIYGSTDGLVIRLQAIKATLTETDDGTTVTKTYASTHEGDSVRDTYDAQAIAGLITSDATQKAAIAAKLAAITSISANERWADFELLFENGDKTKPYLALKINVGGENYSFNLPLRSSGGMSYADKFYGFGSTYHVWADPRGGNGTGVGNFTVSYDLSDYYAPKLAELENEIKAVGALKQDKKAQLEELYAKYQAIPDAQKPYVKNIDTVINALKAFNNGAYIYDDFEGNTLNWKIASKITGTTYDDNLEETNVYSDAAASDAGDNGKAFWGIHSSKEDENNKVLWLRKSFNALNMKPTESNNQTRPSVVAITKDILPEDAKIAFVSGKMYLTSHGYGGTGYKYFSGISYKYNGEYAWDAIGLNAAYTTTGQYVALKAVTRTAEGKGGLDNYFSNYEILDGEPFSVDNQFTLGQWLDFNLEYDFILGCYTYELSGKGRSGETVSIKIKLLGGTELLSEVALLNAAPTQQSFDNIAIGLINSDYAEKTIADLPAASEFTMNDEQSLLVVQSVLKRLSDEEKAKITNMAVYDAVYAKYKELLAQFDERLNINDKLTFEDGESGIEFFEAVDAAGVAGWQVTDNPEKADSNTSSKVLQITRNYSADAANRAIYKIKDSVMNGSKLISNISGKVYIKSSANATIIYDYVDRENWKGFQLDVNGTRVAVRTANRKEGADLSTSGRTNLKLEQEVDETHAVDKNGVWVEFNVEYELLQARLTIKYELDGKLYTAEHTAWQVLNDTCETKIGFCTASTTYIDDIKINFQGTDAYSKAQNFLKDNKYILNLVPAKTFISVIDKEYVEKVVADYAALSDEAKNHIPFIGVRVNDILEAYNTVDPNSAQSLADKAALDKKNNTPSNYKEYILEDNFEDGVRFWQPAREVVLNTGSITTEYHELFGSNVLKMTGTTTITPKSILLPDKPQLKEVSFKILREPTEAQDSYWRLRIYTDYKNDIDFKGYGFYKKDDETKANYRVVYPDKSVSPVNCDLKMDCIWNVKIVYDEMGKYTLTIADAYGNAFIDNSSSSVQSILALAAFNKTTYIDDLKVIYRKGDYDVDEVNDDITVYYSGNTLNSADDIVTLSGENLSDNTSSVEIAPIVNGTNAANKSFVSQTRFDYEGVQVGEYTKEPVAHVFNENAAVKVDIIQRTTDSVKFRIPKEFADGQAPKTAIYAVKIISSTGAHKIIYMNNPVVDFTVGSDGNIASPGTEIRVIGKNLSPDKSAANMKAILQQGAVAREVAITKVQSNYSISVAIPSDVENGVYELWLYSGYGDDTCWAIPTKITVGGSIRDSWKQTAYNIRDFGATGQKEQNATPMFVNALSAMAENGGGILYIPEGVYTLESSLVIPNNCRIIGENVDTTSFVLRPYNWKYNGLPTASFMFEKDVEISNISVIASRAGGIFKACGPSSDNVYFNNIYVYIQPSAGSPSEAPHDIVALLTSAELSAMVAIEKANPVIAFQTKGNNVHMNNVDISHIYTSNRNRRPLVNDSNGSKYWQVDNLSTSGTWTEVIISNSLWENSNHGPNSCMGVWGHGLYFANSRLFDQTDNNRELYVADRSANFRGTFEPYEGDTTGTKWVVAKSLSETLTQHGQLYIYSGQGVGQTRTIIHGQQITVNGTKKTIMTLDRPFSIAPNRNSGVILRRPRENIYFIDNSYENGGCGGFYGGFADVIYDGCKFKQVSSIYQQGIFNDVNWYLSTVNSTVVFKASLGSVAEAGNYGNMTGFSWWALSGVNAQMCLLLRDCEIDGMTNYIRANSKDSSVGIVLQRNEWLNADYAVGFYANTMGAQYENINGMLMADNLYTNVKEIFDPETAVVARYAMGTTNMSASKRLIVLDEGIGVVATDLLGDVNGDGKVSLKDATVITLGVVGVLELTDSQKNIGDVSGDGKVNLRDATLIKLFILGSLDKFPAEGSGEGS